MAGEFKRYRRKAKLAELRPWEPGEDLAGVSVSPKDKEAGCPKEGDMIARNPDNHGDQWLMSKQYFDENIEPEPIADEEKATA